MNYSFSVWTVEDILIKQFFSLERPPGHIFVFVFVFVIYSMVKMYFNED